MNQSETVADTNVFVTPEEIGPSLRRTPRSVRQLMEKGQLPGIRIGGRWLMYRQDYEKLITPQGEHTHAA